MGQEEVRSPGGGVVPEVCPRQTHSNSLQPTQTKIEANFHCFQDTSRLRIESNCIVQ